ncbi:MAG: hypothetical protein K6G73_12560 [Marinilabiliaceae bacterium]|nr:hypothetical protein [Marinilabiliaceae bacterium]
MNIKKYFGIKELVCRHVYNKHGENAWAFFDPRLLETLLWIREHIGKPIIVNNWSSGGTYTQRGLRCNLCELVRSKTNSQTLYMSAHMQGTAVDFDVKGVSAPEVREWLRIHASELPYPIRLESHVSWVHLDVRTDGEKGKVITFKG